MAISPGPYSRDAAPEPPLPDPSEKEERGFVRGTGDRARSGWKWATLGATLLMAVVVAVAGYGSESAGVTASFVAAVVIGFCGGGWVGVVRAQRSGPRLGTPMPYVSAALGATALFVLACVFFFGIFPSL
jgi:hypothetical protein